MLTKQISVNDIIEPVRLIIIDRVGNGQTPTFTDNDIMKAFNNGKSDLWGRHPASFASPALGSDLTKTDLLDRVIIRTPDGHLLEYLYEGAMNDRPLYKCNFDPSGRLEGNTDGEWQLFLPSNSVPVGLVQSDTMYPPTGYWDTYQSETEVFVEFEYDKVDSDGNIILKNSDLLTEEPPDAINLDDPYYMQGWTYNALVLFVSSWLMQMKSKDKYYRQAHISTMKEYEGLLA